jgi:hypothetical protein
MPPSPCPDSPLLTRPQVRELRSRAQVQATARLVSRYRDEYERLFNEAFNAELKEKSMILGGRPCA